jgi:AcrR family transcriptional regulator
MDATNDNRKMSAQEVLTQFRRREILDAAFAFAREEGFARLTMERVAERAGVAKGTLYTYFRDKSELVTVMVIEATNQALARLKAVEDSPGSASERLYRVVEEFKLFAENNKDLFLYIHQPNEVATSFHCAKGEEESHVFREVLNTVSRIVREGMDRGEIRRSDPDIISLVFLNTIHNLFLAYAFFPEMVDRLDAAQLVDLYLDGIRVK